MTDKKWLNIDYLALLLLAAMVLTRSQHFGDSLNLPDASLGVFFFAGLLRSRFFFIVLLVAAALIDFVSINTGTSSFCISPAYIFLVPAYGFMWFGGKFCRKFKILNFSELTLSMLVFVSTTAIAFAISNSSFFLFSGRIGSLSFAHYIHQFGIYFLPYLVTSCGYGLAGFFLLKIHRTLIHVGLSERAI